MKSFTILLLLSFSSSAWSLPELKGLPNVETLDKTTFEHSYSNLPRASLKKKWDAASHDPMHLTRSFVNNWFEDLGTLKNPGPIGPCFGDPHIENFGYLYFDDDKWRFTFNDLDDVGACPVYFDSLRYFTTLHLYLHDKTKEGEVREAYLGFLNGKVMPSPLPSENWRPNITKTMKKKARKNAKGEGLKIPDHGHAISESEKNKIFTALKAAHVDQMQWLDAYFFDHEAGGSAGLARYELLTRDKEGEMQLLELKQLTIPGSAHGPWAKDHKLTVQEFAQVLWGKARPEFMAIVDMEGATYLLRSKNKKNLDLGHLSDADKIKILTEEAYVIAQVHKSTIKGTPELGQWLASGAEIMADRYETAVRNFSRGSK